ncbi:flagellar protein FlaG [Neptunomonas qingdaonensis]|uniref:Flagellar protein FlaG n=1 Tax=Neptunomonas qingdaonensis TaxID=1045558 RepID=A0A1I2N1B8_9GAMM|nr:flagellar protein FlaG [Neptunomonas qingdaonensis]SFF97463.1 flagellar protein FlaG [Neptunomonas qingdaonensis]
MSIESMNASNIAASVQTATSQQTNSSQGSSSVSSAQATGLVNSVNTQATQSESVQDAQKMSAEEVQNVLDKMNEFMGKGQHNLNFSIDKDTDDMVVKVMDTETNEVIRQFPSEQTLKLAKHIDGMLGLILNENA